MADAHAYCRHLWYETRQDTPAEILALFARKNVGVTRCGRDQFAVEFVKDAQGKNRVLYVRADCVFEAKAEAVNVLELERGG